MLSPSARLHTSFSFLSPRLPRGTSASTQGATLLEQQGGRLSQSASPLAQELVPASGPSDHSAAPQSVVVWGSPGLGARKNVLSCLLVLGRTNQDRPDGSWGVERKDRRVCPNLGLRLLRTIIPYDQPELSTTTSGTIPACQSMVRGHVCIEQECKLYSVQQTRQRRVWHRYL